MKTKTKAELAAQVEQLEGVVIAKNKAIADLDQEVREMRRRLKQLTAKVRWLEDDRFALIGTVGALVRKADVDVGRAYITPVPDANVPSRSHRASIDAADAGSYALSETR